MKRLWQLILIFAYPNKCLESIVKECVEQEKPGREAHIREREGKRINALRFSFFRSTAMIAGIFIFGYAEAYFLNTYLEVTKNLTTNLRVAASLLIAWAVLSKLSKEIESFGGKSAPEELNSLIFRITYFLGVSLIICTIYIR